MFILTLVLLGQSPDSDEKIIYFNINTMAMSEIGAKIIWYGSMIYMILVLYLVFFGFPKKIRPFRQPITTVLIAVPIIYVVIFKLGYWLKDTLGEFLGKIALLFLCKFIKLKDAIVNFIEKDVKPTSVFLRVVLAVQILFLAGYFLWPTIRYAYLMKSKDVSGDIKKTLNEEKKNLMLEVIENNKKYEKKMGEFKEYIWDDFYNFEHSKNERIKALWNNEVVKKLYLHCRDYSTEDSVYALDAIDTSLSRDRNFYASAKEVEEDEDSDIVRNVSKIKESDKDIVKKGLYYKKKKNTSDNDYKVGNLVKFSLGGWGDIYKEGKIIGLNKDNTYNIKPDQDENDKYEKRNRVMKIKNRDDREKEKRERDKAKVGDFIKGTPVSISEKVNEMYRLKMIDLSEIEYLSDVIQDWKDKRYEEGSYAVRKDRQLFNEKFKKFSSEISDKLHELKEKIAKSLTDIKLINHKLKNIDLVAKPVVLVNKPTICQKKIKLSGVMSVDNKNKLISLLKKKKTSRDELGEKKYSVENRSKYNQLTKEINELQMDISANDHLNELYFDIPQEASLSTWIFLNSHLQNVKPGYMTLINYMNRPKIEYSARPENDIQLTINKDNVIKLAQDHDARIKLQTWNHLVVNYKRDRVDIFLNGKLVASSKVTFLPNITLLGNKKNQMEDEYNKMDMQLTKAKKKKKEIEEKAKKEGWDVNTDESGEAGFCTTTKRGVHTKPPENNFENKTCYTTKEQSTLWCGYEKVRYKGGHGYFCMAKGDKYIQELKKRYSSIREQAEEKVKAAEKEKNSAELKWDIAVTEYNDETRETNKIFKVRNVNQLSNNIYIGPDQDGDNDGHLAYICNATYYRYALEKQKIEDMYSMLKDKLEPIVY